MPRSSHKSVLIESALKQFLKSDAASFASSKFLGLNRRKKSLLREDRFVDGYFDFLTQHATGITKVMTEFYNEIAFPNYDDLDDFAALIDKASAGKFAKQLDDSIPVGASILEVGCGTGQLGHYCHHIRQQQTQAVIKGVQRKLGKGW